MKNPLIAFVLIPTVSTVACSNSAPAPTPASGGSGGAATSAAGTSGFAGTLATAGAPTGGTTSGGVTSNGGTMPGGAGTRSGAGGTTGSAGDGGTTPGGAAGAAGGAAKGCDGVTSKFCSDFESDISGQAPKGDFTLAGQGIVVDGTKAFSGNQALHITSKKPSPTAMLELTEQFPMNDLHGRAMFFLTRIPSADIHWDLIDSQSQNGVHWEIGGMYGKFILVVDPPDHGLTSDTFPAGSWFCLQWQFKYGGEGQDNTFVAKVDGAALTKGQFTGADAEGEKWDAGPWQSLSIGWTGYGSSDVDIEMWIDDLAFGGEPIACPSP